MISSISTTGSSEYKLNKKVVTYSAYNAALVSHNILVKAKNFLVFQGDVEAVASQSPRELTRLIEQISGSLEYAQEYEQAREEQDRATENATSNFAKRRNIQGEIKQYKEQKGEADRFEELCQQRVCALLPVLRYIMPDIVNIGRSSAAEDPLEIVEYRRRAGEKCTRDQGAKWNSGRPPG